MNKEITLDLPLTSKVQCFDVFTLNGKKWIVREVVEFERRDWIPELLKKGLRIVAEEYNECTPPS